LIEILNNKLDDDLTTVLLSFSIPVVTFCTSGNDLTYTNTLLDGLLLPHCPSDFVASVAYYQVLE